ncbi:MAG: hypothetical protein IJ518_02940 [Clostridia bacterium]|nr:hypothetical protein [Clostridia bacterium]
MKKLLSLCLAVIMLVGLAACGDKPAESDPLTSDVTTTTGDAADITTTAGDTADTTAGGAEESTTTAGDTPTTAPTAGNTDKKPTADVGKTTATTKKKTDKPPANYDITTAPMPKRTLTNKELVYYQWEGIVTDSKSWDSLMKKQFGITFKVKKGNFYNYWSSLAMLIRSGDSPDIVEVSKFSPRVMSMDVLQPVDDILDLNDGLWNETRETMEKYRWKGKVYHTFLKTEMESWFFYNTKMMRNYGVKKTPKELFLEDNWTLEECKKIMDKFATKDGSIWGLSVQNCNLMAIAGVKLVDFDGTNYQLNLKDPKFATILNWIHSVGVAGNNTMQCNDPVGDFCNEKCAMLLTPTHVLYSERAEKIRDDIDWVPMPKLDKDSPYYLEMYEMPNLAIAKGAKNVEGAALALEFRRWLYLGRVQETDYLQPKINAAVKKYKLNVAAAYDHLDKDEVAWTQEILKKYDYVYTDNDWIGWLAENGFIASFPGYYETLREGKPWSSLVETEYNRINALLKAFTA